MTSGFTTFLGFKKKVIATEVQITVPPSDNTSFGVTTGNEETIISTESTPTQQQPTIYPTYTAYPTYTPFPVTATPSLWGDEQREILQPYLTSYIPPISGSYSGPVPGTDKQSVRVRLSYYFPPLALQGGAWEINCDKIDGRMECLVMANGERWMPFVGQAVACPEQWKLGTVIKVAGGTWICKDRGGSIVYDDLGEYYWIDFLYPYMPIGSWGDILDAWVWEQE